MTLKKQPGIKYQEKHTLSPFICTGKYGKKNTKEKKTLKKVCELAWRVFPLDPGEKLRARCREQQQQQRQQVVSSKTQGGGGGKEVSHAN